MHTRFQYYSSTKRILIHKLFAEFEKLWKIVTYVPLLCKHPLDGFFFDGIAINLNIRLMWRPDIAELMYRICQILICIDMVRHRRMKAFDVVHANWIFRFESFNSLSLSLSMELTFVPSFFNVFFSIALLMLKSVSAGNAIEFLAESSIAIVIHWKYAYSITTHKKTHTHRQLSGQTYQKHMVINFHHEKCHYFFWVQFCLSLTLKCYLIS